MSLPLVGGAGGEAGHGITKALGEMPRSNIQSDVELISYLVHQDFKLDSMILPVDIIYRPQSEKAQSDKKAQMVEF